METTLLKSLPWEKTIVESLGHLDSNDGNKEWLLKIDLENTFG